MKTIFLIYNPNSGYFVDKLNSTPKEYFQTHLKTYDINTVFFEIANDNFEDFIEFFEKKEIDEVWIAGGDGSVNTFSKLLKDYNIPIGILPCGTMNLLARDIGMSLDINTAINQLLNSKKILVNVACVNEKEFLCLSNFGMSTKLTHYREKLRSHNFWIRIIMLFWYMVKFAFVYPKLQLKMKIDNDVKFIKTRSVTITNNLLDKNSSLIPIRKKLDSNVLGIYIVKDSSIFSLPRLIFKLLNRDWQDDNDMIIFESKEVEFDIISRHKIIRVMTDGELKTQSLPLKYKINNEKIVFLSPKDLDE